MSRSSVGVIATLLVVSVLAPAAVGGTAAQESDQVTVTVAVVDSNGDPVGDTDISVTWDGGDGGPINKTTAGNGKAFVDVPRGADIRVTVHDDEFVRNRPFDRLNVSEEEIEVDVARSGQATITVESESGPVADAHVVVDGPYSTADRLTTDENGQVTTRRVEQTSYDLRVSKPGFYTNNSASVELDSESVQKTVELERGTKQITFKVVDDNFDSPRPVDGALVEVEDIFSARTFENGETSTSLRVNTEYNVAVSKDGYSSSAKVVEIREEERTVEVGIRRTPDLTLAAANNQVVVGEPTFITATDEYGDPVSDASVTVNGTTVGQTDANGRAIVPINNDGNLEITVSDDRGLSESVIVEGVEDTSDSTPTETTAMTTEEPTEAGGGGATGTEEPEDGDDGDGESGPGFGVVTALAALAVAFVVARRR